MVCLFIFSYTYQFLVTYINKEIIDYGYPQITDIDALKIHITQKGYISEKVNLFNINSYI